jgi:hypothetical protein
MSSHRRAIAVIGALVLAAPFALAAPAGQAATTTDPAQVGMYGAPNRLFREFDAVFNHAIAVLGLTAAGGVVDPLAVDWIVKQQCADGGYVAFRADLAAPCPAPDSAAFTGEDTNSTALAALALRAIGRTTEAARAEQWLEARRSPDGGWAYYPDGAAASDPNSTGVVLMALSGAGTALDASVYGASAQVPCGSADEGAFDYFGPNDLASAQGVLGFAGGVLPPTAPGSWADDAPAVLCPAQKRHSVP